MGDATTLRAYLAHKGWDGPHSDRGWETWHHAHPIGFLELPEDPLARDFRLRLAECWAEVARVEGWTLAGLAEERARREMEEPCT